MARHLKRVADIGLTAVSIEGALISPEQVAAIAATAPDRRAAADYGCPKGTNLRDEITRYFRIGQAYWQGYAKLPAPNVVQTAAFVKSLLEEAFGFEALRGPNVHHRYGHTYRITLEAKGGRVPIVVAAPLPDGDAFTKALSQFGDDHDGTIPRRSPGVLLQDWLNANPDVVWGLVFAGDRVRLMRDNASRRASAPNGRGATDDDIDRFPARGAQQFFPAWARRGAGTDFLDLQADLPAFALA